MNPFAGRLRLLRREYGLSQQTLADKIGISKSSVNMYERGEREPGLETVAALADFFGADADYLLGKSPYKNKNEWLAATGGGAEAPARPAGRRIPMLGDIACGEPIFAQEEHENYVELSDGIRADFCLRAKGDSMIGAHIRDGDIVFIRRQEMVRNGEIAAVIIDDTATLKRVYYDPEKSRLILAAENPRYAPLVYSGAELEQARILGKAVACQSLIR